MSSLKSILKNVRNELLKKEKVRENAQKDMRKVTRCAKQAILLIHQKKIDEAKKLLEKTKEIISKLYSASHTHPKIIFSGLFNAALQEYAEATIFYKLIEESRFITPKEVNVPSIEYVLGLADVIGEFRRLVLDVLREENIKDGENYLEIMDEIFYELMSLDEAYMLVPNLRRKCDIARRIIETTRGDITQELRRNSLKKYLKLFQKHYKISR